MDYKNRLLDLHILLLMYIYEINDIMFFVKSYKKPCHILTSVTLLLFPLNLYTRSASFLKLVHLRSQISDVYHFYFSRLVRLWNSLPAIDITLPDHIIKHKILTICGLILKLILYLVCLAHSTCYVLAIDAPNSLAIHPALNTFN